MVYIGYVFSNFAKAVELRGVKNFTSTSYFRIVMKWFNFLDSMRMLFLMIYGSKKSLKLFWIVLDIQARFENISKWFMEQVLF